MDALYTAEATSIGGRGGSVKSSDGKIDLNLSVPKGLGGDDGAGSNPVNLSPTACTVGVSASAIAAAVDRASSCTATTAARFASGETVVRYASRCSSNTVWSAPVKRFPVPAIHPSGSDTSGATAP
mgnify:CR=1 FL=1